MRGPAAPFLLLPLLLPQCGAWHGVPSYCTKQRHCSLATPATALPNVRAVRKLAMTASSAVHRHQQPGKVAALAAAVLRPLRRWYAAALRLVSGVLQFLRDSREASSQTLAFIPSDVVALDGSRTLDNLYVVACAATRDVPPVAEVLTFFNYGVSPFYAQLPAEAAPPVPALPTGSDTAVRCLRHRYARVPSEFQIAADEGRIALLRELYGEALQRENLQRGRWLPPWADRS